MSVGANDNDDKPKRVQGRFPKKTSGNPRGRPKNKPLSPREAVLGVLSRKTVIRINGKQKRVPKIVAITEVYVERAGQGDIDAARTLGALIRAVSNLDPPSKQADPAAAAPRRVQDAKTMQKILDDYEKRIRKRDDSAK
jgi:hypothetical protein